MVPPAASAEPLFRRVYDAAALVAGHPPVMHHPNKWLVHRIACPKGAEHRGRITCTRWAARAPRFAAAEAPLRVEIRDDYFTYDPAPDPAAVSWHVNFAATELFCAYGSALLAQDEMQVAEHPALASVREALLAEGIDPLTVEHGEPTPVLVHGVERRCAVDTAPDPARGRPHGLYGNRFGEASPAVVRDAVRVLDPPTTSNVLAMEAPAYGRGAYDRATLAHVLATAYTGFAAAADETRRLHGPSARPAIHTGYWGCGVYGGNRTVMALLQVLAARAAGLHTLVFHTGGGTEAFRDALALADADLAEAGEDLSAHLDRTEARGFRWGVGDGN